MCLRCWFDFGEREGRLGQVYLTVIQRKPWVIRRTLVCLIYLSTPHLPPHWLTVGQWEAWPLGKLDNKFQISAVGLSDVLLPSARVILMIAPWSFTAEERTFKIFSQICIYRNGTSSSLIPTSFPLGKSSKQISNVEVLI